MYENHECICTWSKENTRFFNVAGLINSPNAQKNHVYEAESLLYMKKDKNKMDLET
jgi:hypothetical protein